MKRVTSKKGKIIEEFVNSSHSRNDMYLSELKHFFDSINSNIKTDISLEDGLKSLQVCLLAKKGNSLGTIDDFSLEGKIAILTGGAGLLGKQFVKTLLNAQAKVILVDLDFSNLDGDLKKIILFI